MPRPKNQAELLTQARANKAKLMDFIHQMPPESQTAEFPPGTMNRNVRDVLGHVHHWHLMMKNWYEVGMNGRKPQMPAPGYTWKTVPDLNRKIHQTYLEVPLADMEVQFEASHLDMIRIIEQHDDEELFTKKKYPWTGSTSLGAYLISATSSHYAWALKLIKRSLKAKSV